jgi:hypothetical protein
MISTLNFPRKRGQVVQGASPCKGCPICQADCPSKLHGICLCMKTANQLVTCLPHISRDNHYNDTCHSFYIALNDISDKSISEPDWYLVAK